eukprot:1827404-Amphidinium_carterae.1
MKKSDRYCKVVLLGQSWAYGSDQRLALGLVSVGVLLCVRGFPSESLKRNRWRAKWRPRRSVAGRRPGTHKRHIPL